MSYADVKFGAKKQKSITQFCIGLVKLKRLVKTDKRLVNKTIKQEDNLTEIEVDKGKKIEVDMRKKFEVNKRKKSDPFRILTEKTREKRNISTGFHLIQKKKRSCIGI